MTFNELTWWLDDHKVNVDLDQRFRLKINCPKGFELPKEVCKALQIYRNELRQLLARTDSLRHRKKKDLEFYEKTTGWTGKSFWNGIHFRHENGKTIWR